MNEKYIICDFGRSDWGKSQTLLKVIDMLKAIVKPTVEELIDDYDKYALFDINGKRIVVSTQGDPDSYQEEGLNRAVAQNADVIVCASRTKGSTLETVYEIAKNGYQVVRFSNFFAEEKDLPGVSCLPEISAGSIVEFIQRI